MALDMASWQPYQCLIRLPHCTEGDESGMAASPRHASAAYANGALAVKWEASRERERYGSMGVSCIGVQCASKSGGQPA